MSGLKNLHALFRLMGYAPGCPRQNQYITGDRQGDDHLVNEAPGTRRSAFVAAHEPRAVDGVRVVDAEQAYVRLKFPPRRACSTSLGAERRWMFPPSRVSAATSCIRRPLRRQGLGL